MSGVPYQEGSFTPTRVRRPYTPTNLGTFRGVRTPLGRPHSPATIGSGAQTPTGTGHTPHVPSALGAALSRVESGASSTVASSGTPAAPSSSGYSSSGSPVSSPRILNVKAATFNPVSSPAPKQLHLGSINTTAPAFVPSDAWRDADASLPRSGSPFTLGGSQGMVRTGSNRLIAAPIISDPSSPFHSPLGTPTRGTKLGGPVTDPFSSLSSPTAGGRPASRGVVPDDDDDDEFSPFGTALPRLHHHEPSGLSTSAKPFEPFNTNAAEFYPSSASGATGSDQSASYESQSALDPEDDPTQNATLGMTPLDVLSSVFSTVPRRELEDALHRSGYDFEASMAMLVSQYTHPRSGASTPQRVASPRPLIGVDGARTNHLAPSAGFFQQGGRGFNPPVQPTMVRNQGPTRMCRYFLNGECRRSDCRFSHDLDRALCRFWLRGHCAKGPNCEFLHQLPTNLDGNALAAPMGRIDINSQPGSMPGTPSGSGLYGATDDFPDLLAARLNRATGRFDPSRNRFANAVKRPIPVVQTMVSVSGASGRFSPAPPAPGSDSGAAPPKAPAVPRPSQRLKLRPPKLLPTLSTGSIANEQYMTTRATSIRLGNARNACLARAADAFRRGDGAAAKRFSREGKSLNEKMVHEANEAAQVLVKERMRDAQKAVKERDPAWSDDPRDRAERGKECGGGLGVILGVAGASSVPDGSKLSAEERTEALLDLHTLHGSEGTELLGHFLAELERSRYRGLVYIVVGEEKHVGTQDAGRGASKVRLAASIKQFLADWGYAWNENAGVICVDPCR